MVKEMNFFHSEKKVDISKVQRINLGNNNKIYFIENGNVDVFIEEKKDNKFLRKTFLVNVAENNIFFGFEQTGKDIEIIAIASSDTTIYEMSYEEIVKNFEKKDFFDEFSKKLDTWILNIFDNLILTYREDIETFAAFEKETNLQSENYKDLLLDFAPKEKNEIKWVEIKKGKVNFLNEEQIVLNTTSVLPLSYKVWLSFKDEVSIYATSLENVLKSKSLNEILKFFHKVILDYALISIVKEQKRQENKIQKKQEVEKKLLAETLSSFLNVFYKREVEIPRESKNSLFNALQIIGSFSKIKFDMPSKLYEKEIKNMVFEICDYSSIRYREVSLKEQWYKKQAPNFLAFLKEDDKPVALIRRKNHYVIIDPETKSQIEVNETTVDKIFPVAYEFHDTFADEKLDNRKIFKFCLKNQSKEIINFVIFSLLSIILAFYIPFANSVIFNRIIPFLEKDLLYQISIGLFISVISAGIFSFISSYITLRLQSQMRVRFQVGLFDRLLRLPISFFRKYTIGDLQKRLFEMFEVQRMLSSGFISSLFMGVFSLLYLILMFYYSYRLALISVIYIGVFAGIFAILLRFKIKVDTEILNEQSKLNGFFLQVISGIEKIRLSASENILFAKWGIKYSKIRSKTLTSNYLVSVMSSFNAIVMTLGTFIILAMGIYLLKIKEFNLGNFIAFNAAFTAFATAMNSAFITIITYIGMIIPRWKRAKIILNEMPENTKGAIDPNVLKGFIDVDNVSFRYDEKSPLVLKNVSFKAGPGEFIALVGPTNCGKSTLIRLLLNYYKPNSGSVYFDGINLSDLDVSKVRKQLGVVLQGSEVFSGTIEENLISTKLVTRNEMEEVMKITHFDETLKSFPMGLHTYLTDNGKNLSGGQKQQLLLTRALISNPKILILDEATSFLDNETQKTISDNVDKLRITRIVIAHRLDTVKNADRIYFMKEGEVIDSGTFEELNEKNKSFQDLVLKQLL